MVQAIENRSLVRCTPRGEPRPGPADGWSTAVVLVERTSPAGAAADLMTDAVGREYTALVPPDLVPRLSGERVWTVEVEVTGPKRITIRSLG